MKEKVIDTIIRNNLIEKGDNVVVGVSGGPDSMALLYVLREAKERIDFNLYIAHINHGVRGKEADEDEEYVRRVSNELRIPFYSIKVDMSKYAKENRLSEEEAGREIRYNFFRQVLSQLGNGKIAVAHNKNDQAETLVMRFIRGTGLDGLKGMDYKNGDIIRPLLDVSRDEIEEYIKENNIEVRIDKTNFKPIYSRNKIRLELIPFIKENFNESFIDTIYRTSRLMAIDSDFLKKYALEKYEQMVYKETKDKIIIDREEFSKQHDSIKSRILRMAIERLLGHIKGIEEKHIYDAINLILKNSTGKRINLPKNIQISIGYGHFTVEKVDLKEKIVDYKYMIGIESTTQIDELKCEIITEILNVNEVDVKKNNRFIKYFDYDKIYGNLYIRNRRPGDRFSPLGMKGKKKLKDFFIDLKIPRDMRDRIPLLVDDCNIIWVVGYRISEIYKIKPETKRVLKIQIKSKEDLYGTRYSSNIN
ncbi:tRNA(Ile)-lysidine synthase [Caloranaerobacter azorensis DSM 13643]|uniref:tRNA(Ile)-lysidine synthase n=1 Tax=Caloranaerobacter azorensis DSM 13643 TaxID=1121264 RepID=A0A1M5SWK9_9FIRM|nr:tRNA lysidine(34) synthetase TilS [Caloranaerobacter azorensis]SHH42628.1 tRNA(Ile)-lysidine synthase [Caloranaerobacter azorensis DSM 13643]